MPNLIEGVCPVLSVPFTESGEVDYESFTSLVEWIISIGTKSVLFFGVASENIKLNDSERYALLEALLNLRQGSGLKVVASVADHSSELASKRARDYQAMGVDLINILPPSFFAPSAEQIKFHISAILDSVTIPVIVQHLPQSGGLSEVTDLLTLAKDHSNFAMVKCEANPPIDSIKSVFKETNGRVKSLIGWGGISWYEGAQAGAVGIQPGCGVTDLYLWAEQALNQGNLVEFKSRLEKFIPIIAGWLSNLELLIAAEKRILQKREIIATDYCRHPTVSISPEIDGQIAQILELVNEVNFKTGLCK